MKSTLESAHEAIIAEKLSPYFPRRLGSIATTGVVARIYSDDTGAKYVSGAHAGDSRAYVFSNGRLINQTLDHTADFRSMSYIDRKVRQDKLSRALDDLDLNLDEIRAFNRRNLVSSSLGNRYTSPFIETFSFYLKQSDRVLLASDGLTDNLTDPEIEAILRNDRLSHSGHAKVLATAALARSYENKAEVMRAKKDDITAVLLQITS
jgi:protein phosphatase